MAVAVVVGVGSNEGEQVAQALLMMQTTLNPLHFRVVHTPATGLIMLKQESISISCWQHFNQLKMGGVEPWVYHAY